jgi:signal transduction histidine kinase/PAS domain-containing protein/ActR/RegA family two-component response regulator
MTGLDPSVVGKRALEILPGIAETGLLSVFDEVVRTRESRSLECRIPGMDRRFELAVFPLEDAEFGVCLFNVTDRDPTEQWRSESALRHSESQFQNLFNSLPVGVMMISKSGVILHRNRAASELLPFDLSSLASVNHPDLPIQVTREDGSLVRDGDLIWQECVRTGKPAGGVVRGLSLGPGEPVRWVMVHAEPIIDHNTGEVASALVSFQDITELKKTQDLLITTANAVVAETGVGFLRSLVGQLAKALHADFALVGEYQKPQDGSAQVHCHVLYANNSFSEGHRYSTQGTPCEVVLDAGQGCYPSGLRSLFPQDTIAMRLGVESYIGMRLDDRLGRPLGLIAVMWKTELKDVALAKSLIRIFAARASAELDRMRAEEALLRYTQELEASREAERLTSLQLRQTIQELAEARSKAEVASHAKSEFLATISHEIRTPLNAILGMTDLLMESGLHGQQREDAQSISNAANLLLMLINDVLDFSKIESGHMILERIRFSLSEVIQKSIEMVRLDASRKNLALVVEFDPGLPELVIGDPARLHQVLINLLSNAVKFTHTGSVVLRAAVREVRPESTILRFTVTDSGIGIPREAQPRLFEPFVQADASTTRRFGGTGLGLAICRRLVEAMGGTLSLESEAGAGSTFWFDVPLETADREIERPRKSVFISPELRPGKILLAEDNPINRLVAVRMIQKIGCTVQVVHNGREAVEAALRDRYDVILLDCQMPEVDGYQAAREIRRLEGPEWRNVIVALTASALPGVREKCFDAGMDDYIAKPVSLASLHGILAKWLDSTIVRS